MLPPHQRLETDNCPVDARRRLVIQDQFTVLDGGSQFLLKHTPVAQPLIHLGLEEAECTTSLSIGSKECRIRTADQIARVAPVNGINRDTDTDAVADRLAVEGDRLFE